MLRITTTRLAEDGELMVLEGRLVGPWVAECARQVALARSAAPRVVLDLSDLTYVDRDGVRLLRQLAADRVEVRGGSSFIASLLKETT